MCGRFFVAMDDPEILEILKEIELENRRQRLDLPPIKTGEVFPKDYSAVRIAPKGEAPRHQQMRWGFTSYDQKGLLINARAETVLQKDTFKKPALESRCLIPASYYFEWKKDDKTNRKIKHIMRDSRSTTLYMAGIFRMEADDSVPRYVILTRNASKEVSDIHHRMPVIFDHQEQEAWLQRHADVPDIINHALDRISALEDFPDE